MKILVLFCSVLFSMSAMAEDMYVDEAEADREPAMVNSASRRSFPGGKDEEDLKVLQRLPDAELKTDARYIQREVYRALYNQELRDERVQEIEE